tara:strand:- start:920 stop:1285 length:366 start_codon:yes stop_codon:yes gene_type:complete
MAIIKGEQLTFGVTSAAGGATSPAQSYSQTNGINIKELKDKNGDTKSVAFYRKTEEISVDFLGIPSSLIVGAALADALQAATEHGNPAAAECIIDEVTIDKANEEHVKTSVRATSYGIPLS